MNIIKHLLILLSILLIITSCEDDYLTINAFEAEGTTVNYNLPDTSSTLQVAVVSFQCSRKKSDNVEKIFEQIDLIMNSNSSVHISAQPVHKPLPSIIQQSGNGYSNKHRDRT